MCSHRRGKGSPQGTQNRKKSNISTFWKRNMNKTTETKPKLSKMRVWTPAQKHSETGCLKPCNMFENAPLNGSLNHLQIDEKTHLGTPGTAEAHCGIPWKALGVPPGTKTHTKHSKTRFIKRELAGKRRRPKTFPRKPLSEN